MSHLAEIVATAAAGAVGSTVAALSLDASLMFVLPVTLGVVAVALLTSRDVTRAG